MQHSTLRINHHAARTEAAQALIFASKGLHVRSSLSTAGRQSSLMQFEKYTAAIVRRCTSLAGMFLPPCFCDVMS